MKTVYLIAMGTARWPGLTNNLKAAKQPTPVPKSSPLAQKQNATCRTPTTALWAKTSIPTRGVPILWAVEVR